jgi:hypothetical protein
LRFHGATIGQGASKSQRAWDFTAIGEILELPAWGGKMILAALVLDLPVALIFAWVYEMTPEGIRLEKEVDRSQSITHSTGRKLDRAYVQRDGGLPEMMFDPYLRRF